MFEQTNVILIFYILTYIFINNFAYAPKVSWSNEIPIKILYSNVCFLILVRKTNIPEDPYANDQVLPAARELQTSAYSPNTFTSNARQHALDYSSNTFMANVRPNLNTFKKYNFPQAEEHAEDFFPQAKRFEVPQTQQRLWGMPQNNFNDIRQYTFQQNGNINILPLFIPR